MNGNVLKSPNLIDDFQENTKENTFDSCLVSSERTNNNKDIKKKTVKFSGEVVFIDVECWKKYNAEQTAEENFDEIDEDEKKEQENKPSDNNDRRRNKAKENVFCTCNVI